MTRVAIYCRVSTESQAEEGLSLDTQIRSCVDYARLRNHPLPVCVYMDAGLSGASVAKRPAMTALLAAVESGTITHVITTKLDRAFRSVKDATHSLERIKRAGASIAFLDLQIDTSTAAGEMVFHLMSAFAQFEGKQAGERIHAVNHRIVAGGRWVGRQAPYGYDKDPETKGLTINQREAEIVRRIFEEYSRDESTGYNQIARRLQVEGIASPEDRRWVPTVVKRILANPVYMGDVVYGRQGRKKHELWLSDEGRIRAQGGHAPIIDRETWERTRRKMLAHRTPGRATATNRLLAGRLWCGYCQSRLYASGSGDRKYYTCANVYHATKEACPQHKRIFESMLDRLVIAAVSANIQRAKAAGWQLRRAERKPRNQERDREWLQGKLDRLQIVFIDGGLTREEYERKRDALRGQIAALEEEAPAPVLPPADALEGFAAHITDEAVPMELRRRLVESLIERIVVDADGATIHYKALPIKGWKSEDRVTRQRGRPRGWRKPAPNK